MHWTTLFASNVDVCHKISVVLAVDKIFGEVKSRKIIRNIFDSRTHSTSLLSEDRRVFSSTFPISDELYFQNGDMSSIRKALISQTFWDLNSDLRSDLITNKRPPLEHFRVSDLCRMESVNRFLKKLLVLINSLLSHISIRFSDFHFEFDLGLSCTLHVQYICNLIVFWLLLDSWVH